MTLSPVVLARVVDSGVQADRRKPLGGDLDDRLDVSSISRIRTLMRMVYAASPDTLARRYLADALPRRWAHVQAVAARAATVVDVAPADSEIVISAAWLHDLGYAPDLMDSGFHPLDGARYLRRVGADDRLCRLVAHHSAALAEATERGLAVELDQEFPQEHSAAADALWYADMTTGPSGELMTAEDRLAEIASRYGPDHVVTRSLERARPELLAAVRRTEDRLATIGVQST